MNYRSIPKIELHVHLDGSIRPITLATLAGVSVELAYEQSVAPNKCEDLNDYLTRFNLPISVMQTYENIKLVSKELAEDLKRDNVVYAEIRFAPKQHLQKGLTLEQVVEAAIAGLSEVNIKAKLILSMMRNHTILENKKIVDLAHQYEGYVGGVDLAGAEALYPTKDFKELFDYAKSLGVSYTIHAGEADGSESINSAIEYGTKRIGHGIRCLEDIECLNRIINDKILLEICPTSNVQTNVVNNIKEHPFYELYKKGAVLSINTDNRTVSNVSLSDEYQNLIENSNLTEEDLLQINIKCIEYTFTTKEEKLEIHNLLTQKK